MLSPERLCDALASAREQLMAARHPEGYWEGRLSSSALSTATAVAALSLAGRAEDRELVNSGLQYLGSCQNADGGWGDTPDSPSNLATSLLALAAMHIAGSPEWLLPSQRRAEDYVARIAGAKPADRVGAVAAAYGDDRTFAVPILVTCALADLVSWDDIPSLPFQLAAMPQRWYRRLGMQVVSYALPALIALGLALHHNQTTATTVRRTMRGCATGPALRRLRALQPEHGGFLEAAPLTAFVALGLIAAGRSRHVVVDKCLEFLRASVREDGSWPIDTNLSVWVTSSAVNALQSVDGAMRDSLELTRKWIADRQYERVHPFTGAAPGGWGWTHLPGGVPDADDTAGAILALSGGGYERRIADGVRWLVGLQNSDGGWPTFCRGWGRLPFDQSCADITAHVLRALEAAQADAVSVPVTRAVSRGMAYLGDSQMPDGSWLPLWFGNQFAPDHGNPVLGTARVLMALALLDPDGPPARAGLEYLVRAQHRDGGWGGAPGVVASMEETAVALSAISNWAEEASVAVAKGAAYLVARVQDETWTETAPIGLYFASLWYSEQLYPIIWTLEALGRARRALYPTAGSLAGGTQHD